MTDKELREQAEKVYRQLWERDVFQGFPHDQDVATIAAALEEAWAKVDIAKRWTRQERDRADRAEAERDALKARVKELEGLLTRALVAEGLCSIRWCEDTRAALRPEEER